MQVNIPINYINLPENIAIVDTLPEYLNVKVQDKGISLLGFSVSQRGKPLIVDFQQLNPNENTYYVSEQYLTAECLKRLQSTSKLISLTPSSIPIHSSPLKEKRVPVLLNGDIIPSIGFMLTDKIRFSPSEVVIHGAEKVLDSINGIYTERIHLTEVEKSRSFLVNLSPPQNIRLVNLSVNLVVKIEEYTEKRFEVPIVAKDFPQNHRLRTFPTTVQIACLLPLSQYAATKASHFEASIYYADTQKDTTAKTPVIISQKPDWVDNYRFNPEQVEYLIEQIQQK